MWIHTMLGHISQQQLNKLTKDGLLKNINKVNLFTYKYCLTEKSIRKSIRKGTRAEFSLQLIHFDIMVQ
jgi:hypothetical protein